jgi:hypothetical protein
MESKTTTQVKAADVASAVTAAMAKPDTRFIVIGRGEGGSSDDVEMSVVTEESAASAPAPK